MGVRRATVTIPDDLDAKLAAYTAAEAAAPSFTVVVQAALRRFLTDPEGLGTAPSLIGKVLANRDQIKRLAARHGASNVRLFGSTARGEEDTNSDLDLLVSFQADRSLFDLARLRVELESLLEVPVDLVTDAGLTGPAREEILTEAISL